MKKEKAKIYLCPVHNKTMLRKKTSYGPLHVCPVDNCDILKWGDNTKTTPADAQTRKARINAHTIFDCLWKDGHMTRQEAYRRLAEYLGLKIEDTHIGLFDIKKCYKAIQFAVEQQNGLKGK